MITETFISHFSIEGIFKFDSEQVTGGGDRATIAITTPEASVNGGIFNLCADNFKTGSGVSTPTFTLTTPGQYISSSQYSNVVIADARSDEPIVQGNIYHLLGTFSFPL